jgi:hypothetical protein
MNVIWFLSISFFGIFSIKFWELHGGSSANAFISKTGTQIRPISKEKWMKQAQLFQLNLL